MEESLTISIGCDMEDIPAVVSISTISAQNQAQIPPKIVFCGRDVLLQQVVGELVGARISASQKEQVLAGDRVPTTRPSTEVIGSESSSCVPLVQVWSQKRRVKFQQLLERIQLPFLQRGAKGGLVRRVGAPSQQFGDRALQRKQVGLFRFLRVRGEIILVGSKRAVGVEVFQYIQSTELGGMPNEGDLRQTAVTRIGVSSRCEIPPLLPMNVQSPILFTLWTFWRIFRPLGFLRNIDTLAGASDVFVQEFCAILAEERVFACQLCEGDGSGKLSSKLRDLNERLEIVTVNCLFNWFQVKDLAILGVGKISNYGFQERFGSNVVTDLHVLSIEVDELGFLLIIIRIVSKVTVGPLGVTLFVGVA